MYILYESYTDETRNMKDLRFNTKIVGIYKDTDKIDEIVNDYANSIIDNLDSQYNWYIKEFDKKLLDKEDKNKIKVYEVYNDFIDNAEEIYYLILEKVKGDE